jgi:hypothetical protein
MTAIGCSSAPRHDGDQPPAPPTGMQPNTPAPAVMNQPVAGNSMPAGMTSQPAVEPGTMAGGSAGGPAAEPPDMKPSTDPGMTDPMVAVDEFPDPRGVDCAPSSGFPGDEGCLAPPKDGEGMQIHIGPSNYDDPAEVNKFVFHPGQEASNCWTIRIPNKEVVYYQSSVLSGRPGTHHIINTGFKAEAQLTEGGFTDTCDGTFLASDQSIGALPGASKLYMERRPIAPENAHLGREIPADSFMQADMHYFNFTDKDILREFWLNLYFIPKEEVTDTPNQIRGMGGFSYQITPGTDHVYQYTAPITADGRIIELLGHYHSHGERFTAYLKRKSGEELKVFEMYDYLDPLVFDYNSIAKNPEFSDSSGGAYTGMLEVKAGDTLEWECHIVNDSDTTLTYINEVKSGEMCNLWGASVGTKIEALLPDEVPF